MATKWFDVEVVFTTDKAVRVLYETEEIWIPRVCLIDYSGSIEHGNEVEIELEESYAEGLGMMV